MVSKIFSHDDHVRGYWLTKSDATLIHWEDGKLAVVEQNACAPKSYKHHVIQEFRELIESDPEILQGFTEMFDTLQDTGAVDSYTKMLAVFDVVLGEAPIFKNNTMVAFPILAVVIGPMATSAGFRMFSHPRVNAMIKKMLDTWYQYLSSPLSRYVLNDGPTGWFGPAASHIFPNFASTFICDPFAPYHGFQSWEDFFVRRFRPGVRPVHFPEDDSIVTSACESSVFRIEHNVKDVAQFWLKGHPYSVLRMLNHDPLSLQFVGGTVYQAFLSALEYHRWHSPVNGTVVKTVVVPGTYYLEAIGLMDDPGLPRKTPGPDPRRLNRSQDCMAMVAARCLIFIQADNPAIGLMCFVGIGDDILGPF
ncbi:hypothetical protein EUX98_g3141 [Antrodiella citrinella]|uniref:L-tryptophan decarboxylase PsiD-like domain-containing protein n=1 Tax=Antrodiella citrinella TaxID=2447956 RepID=A0A4S4MXB3_9APHY|nr:hypothetical protein EUX98_g3141 [Antrodiella citrinella]